MGQPANKRNPFVQTSVSDTLRDAMARARWIALDLDTTRFAVLSANTGAGRGRLTLCFDSDYPKVSAESRYLLVPAAKPLLEHAQHSTKPCTWSDAEPVAAASGLVHCLDLRTCASGIAFPVATAHGQSGIVVFFGQFPALDDSLLLDVHARCFPLFDAAAGLANPRSGEVVVATRERDCLELSSHGLTSEEIAAQLTLSPYTINQYLTNTARKLGAVNRVHVVAKALRLGLIT